MKKQLFIQVYTWYGFNRQIRNIKSTKGSGGVGIFVKNTLLETFTVSIVDQSVDGILFLLFVNKITQTSIVVSVCYLPPNNSLWGRDADRFFAHILSVLYTCIDYDQIILTGDYNARIGNMRETIHDLDDPPERQVIDSVKSGHWESFVDFLKDSKTCILNGRVTPAYDNYTCISARGKSVVDYILTTHENITNCTACHVDLTSDLIEQFDCSQLLGELCKAPDHSMLTIILRYNTDLTPQVCETTEQHISESLNFKEHNLNKLGDAVNFMQNEHWTYVTNTFVNELENVESSQGEIDRIYDKFLTNIHNEIDKHLPLRVKHVKNKKHNKPYWTDELTHLWKSMHCAEKQFVKFKGDRQTKHELHQAFIQIRHNFDKTLRKMERQYKRKKILEIEIKCNQNPREFWTMLKNLGPHKKHDIPLKIYENEQLITNTALVLDRWYRDFSELYNVSHESEHFDNNFIQNAQQVIIHNELSTISIINDTNNHTANEELNREITNEELSNVLKKTEKQKSTGYRWNTK